MSQRDDVTVIERILHSKRIVSSQWQLMCCSVFPSPCREDKLSEQFGGPHYNTHVSRHNILRSNKDFVFYCQNCLSFIQSWFYQLHQGVGQQKKVPLDGFTSVCVIKAHLSQQTGPYMFAAHFLCMLTLSTCFFFQTSRFLFFTSFS